MAQPTDDSLSDQINMVGEGTIFEGTLRAESNVRVSGRIKGTLQVDGRAIITQEGAVEGELLSADADVAGSVQGEIHVEERLMLKSTARVDGSIEAGRIKVEEGALFTGKCTIGENVEQEVRDHIEKQSWSEEQETPTTSSPSGGGASTSGGSTSASGSASRSGSGAGSGSSSSSSSKSSSSSSDRRERKAGGSSEGTVSTEGETTAGE